MKRITSTARLRGRLHHARPRPGRSGAARHLLIAALLGVAVFGTTTPVEAGGQARSVVCHDGDDGIEMITIADPALDAHIAHGDALPGDPAPGGGVYADDCSILFPDSDGDGHPDDQDACPFRGDEGNGVDSTGCPVAPPQPPELTYRSACEGLGDVFDFVTSTSYSEDPSAGELNCTIEPAPPTNDQRNEVFHHLNEICLLEPGVLAFFYLDDTLAQCFVPLFD